MNTIDLRGTELARLALYPQTVDTDRYARDIRNELNKHYNDTNTGEFDLRTTRIYTLVFAGALRNVKHGCAIEDNRVILETALDILTDTCQLIWR